MQKHDGCSLSWDGSRCCMVRVAAAMTAKIEADSASVTASFAHHAARVEQSPLSYAGAQDSRRRSDTMDQPPEECAVAQQEVV